MDVKSGFRTADHPQKLFLHSSSKTSFLQVESRYGGRGKRTVDMESLFNEPSTQQMQEALDSNVDQITTVKKGKTYPDKERDRQ